MDRIIDGDLEILVGGPVGFGNNIYLVIDRSTNEAAFIDAPDGVDEMMAIAEQAGVVPSRILLTHSHEDHTAAIDDLKTAYQCIVYADAAEPWLRDGQVDQPVSHGEEIALGNLVFKALSVPGHTPGSVTYVCGAHAFVGDTLFPGGPGRSQSNQLLHQEIASINTHLYSLPDETTIYPGHGVTTTIGMSKAEYAVFASKDHDPDLHGDVNWLES